MQLIFKKFRKISFLLVGLILFLGMSALYVQAKECENAFLKCARDPVVMTSLVGGLYCGIGYIFCKKYIEN